MLLEADLGNSRCKWRIIDDGGKVAEQGVCADLQGFRTLPLDYPVRRVRASCVAGNRVESRFAQWARAEFGVQVAFARAAAEVAGVRNGYGQPERLGVDRWLAAVAAYCQLKRAVVVVDAGSALTVDVVDADGQHLGGYIVPGRQLMYEALRSGTHGVSFGAGESVSLAFGRDTDQAVHGGVNAALLGVVQVAIRQARQRLPAGFAIVITGGAGADLPGWLEAESHEALFWQPDLVLDGLQWVLP